MHTVLLVTVLLNYVYPDNKNHVKNHHFSDQLVLSTVSAGLATRFILM
jgi:hypothetical protein